MNTKIFTHFMNKIDDLGERATGLVIEINKLREELEKHRPNE